MSAWPTSVQRNLTLCKSFCPSSTPHPMIKDADTNKLPLLLSSAVDDTPPTMPKIQSLVLRHIFMTAPCNHSMAILDRLGCQFEPYSTGSMPAWGRTVLLIRLLMDLGGQDHVARVDAGLIEIGTGIELGVAKTLKSPLAQPNYSWMT